MFFSVKQEYGTRGALGQGLRKDIEREELDIMEKEMQAEIMRKSDV